MFDKKKIQFFIVNSLTILRLIIAPVVSYLIFSNLRVEAFIIFLIGVATDLLDGDLARRFNVTSKLGEFLDALADLTLTYSGVIPLFILNEFPPLIKTCCLIATFLAIVAIIKHSLKNKKFTFPRRKASTTINSYFLYTALAFYIINSPHKHLIGYLTCLILALTAFDYFTSPRNNQI
jgi:cardiolipin synthase